MFSICFVKDGSVGTRLVDKLKGCKGQYLREKSRRVRERKVVTLNF